MPHLVCLFFVGFGVTLCLLYVKGGGKDEKDGDSKFSDRGNVSIVKQGLRFSRKAADNQQKFKYRISKLEDSLLKRRNKMKKLIYVLVAIAMMLASNGVAFAHSGRTNSMGGHWNRVDYGYPVYEYNGR